MNLFKKTNYIIVYAIFVCITGFVTKVNAQLQTARIFTNGMVLQRDIEIPVWGTSTVGDTVIVTLNLVSDTAYADGQGKWQASLSSLSAGGPYTMTITGSNETLTRMNVYIGDVWFASGQSNMAMQLSASDGGTAEASSANYETIRQFFVQNALGNEPADDVPSGSSWTPATSAYAANFTAVGYYFARDLHAEIGVPIGIINASQGGARIETFMSEEMLGYDENDVVLANGENERQPTKAYNTMIHPLLNFPIKGVIWYQAESNGDNMEDAISYGSLFKKFITDWRSLMGLGDIPFLWVQLPNQGTAAVESSPGAWDAWPRLRAAQSRALSLPNTGEATTIDVGDVDIHPTNKETVGNRLSLLARKIAYSEDIVYSGPRYKSHKLVNDSAVLINFDHIGSGLKAINTSNDSIHWFSIAGSDGTLVSAKAVLYGDSALVWNDQVTDPEIVRYAWEYNPENINFYNEEDLPAAPFRIKVNNPGFEITSFTTTETVIERGKSAVLSWEVYGASSVTLNNVPYDSIDGTKVWPLDTTSYTLKIVNRDNINDTDSLVITINIIDPLPTIILKIDEGDIVSPGTEVTLIATANAPGGGTVASIKFYIDDVLVFTDTEPPYETTWLPPGIGEYEITAIVINGDGVSVESTPVSLLVTNLTTIIYEAEDAVYTGNGSEKSSTVASGGKYVDLTDGWTLTFSDVSVPVADEYQLGIRYLLNYESPKTQNLVVNGSSMGAIEFTAPDNSTWMTYRTMISLNSGVNEIAIAGSWYWMSFDYISLTGEGLVGINKTIDVDQVSISNNPNPFSFSTDITYTIPKPGHVKLEIFDVTGKQIVLLVNQMEMEGPHIYKFNADKLKRGVYFSRLTYNTDATINKMLLIH